MVAMSASAELRLVYLNSCLVAGYPLLLPNSLHKRRCNFNKECGVSVVPGQLNVDYESIHIKGPRVETWKYSTKDKIIDFLFVSAALLWFRK